MNQEVRKTRQTA